MKREVNNGNLFSLLRLDYRIIESIIAAYYMRHICITLFSLKTKILPEI